MQMFEIMLRWIVKNRAKNINEIRTVELYLSQEDVDMLYHDTSYTAIYCVKLSSLTATTSVLKKSYTSYSSGNLELNT